MKGIGIPVLLGLLGVCAGCSTRPSRAAPPDIIIFLVADTQRADHMGCYGYARDTTPYLSADLDRWIRFDGHYSTASYTGPSFGSILSGQWPWTSGILHWERMRARMIEGLRAAGYRALCLASVRVPWFRNFYESFDETSFDAADGTTRKIVEILGSARKGEKLLVFAHYTIAHMPYTYRDTPFMKRPPKYDVMKDWSTLGMAKAKLRMRFAFPRLYTHAEYDYTVAIYDNQILEMDKIVKRLMQVLEDRDLLDRSLVIFTADHGESLGEDGVYFWHGFSLRESNIRVPLLIFDGGRSAVVSQITRHIDLWPTIASRVGIDPGGAIDGVPLDATIRGRASENRAAVSLSMFYDRRDPLDFEQSPLRALGPEGRMVSVRLGRWKLLRRTEANGGFHYSLYDLPADPFEALNLADSHPAIAEALVEIASRTGTHGVPGVLDSSTVEALKSLGYL